MPAPLLIADVEKETGIPRATLRVWEQRYGFPRPGRSSSGQRTYPAEQVQQLRTVQQLVRRGHRPGKLLGLAPAELRKLSRGAARRAATALPPDPVLQLLRAHDAGAILHALRQSATTLGLERFVQQVAALNRIVGQAWECGELEVFEEHVYVEAVQTVLRQALLDLPAPTAADAPVVVLATAPQESHGLGLLMAQALLALQGCRCVSLGVQVPLEQITAAARAYACDVVALSFSSALQSRRVTEDLVALRQLLPPSVGLWAGGSSPALRRQAAAGITVFDAVDAIPAAVAACRAAKEAARQAGVSTSVPAPTPGSPPAATSARRSSRR